MLFLNNNNNNKKKKKKYTHIYILFETQLLHLCNTDLSLMYHRHQPEINKEEQKQTWRSCGIVMVSWEWWSCIREVNITSPYFRNTSPHQIITHPYSSGHLILWASDPCWSSYKAFQIVSPQSKKSIGQCNQTSSSLLVSS